MTNGRLIAITGPAASGKSTVASRLQATFARGGDMWLAVKLDDFAASLPRAWIAWGGQEGRHASLGFAYTRAEDGRIDLTVGTDGRRVLAAFHRSVAAVAASGVNVICETIVFDQGDWDDWLESLRGISTCWVKLSAPVAILEKREKADRPVESRGLARGMSARPPVGAFDIEADTADEEIDAIVERVAARTALPSN